MLLNVVDYIIICVSLTFPPVIMFQWFDMHHYEVILLEGLLINLIYKSYLREYN